VRFQLRQEMVERQLRRRGIRDVRVLEAMSKVPREIFVPLAFLPFVVYLPFLAGAWGAMAGGANGSGWNDAVSDDRSDSIRADAAENSPARCRRSPRRASSNQAVTTGPS